MIPIVVNDSLCSASAYQQVIHVYSVKLKDSYWSVSSYTVLFLYLCMQLPRSLAVTMEMFVLLTDQTTGREG